MGMPTLGFQMTLKLFSSKPKPFHLSLIFLFLTLLLITVTFQLRLLPNDDGSPEVQPYLGAQRPKWYGVVAEETQGKRLKIGLVNVEGGNGDELHGLAETVNVVFDRVGEEYRWEDFFPEWIDEDENWGAPSCPEMPMPRWGDYGEVDMDVVVARAPCGGGEREREGVRDVFGLQVNLVVANVLVRSGWKNMESGRRLYAVFVGSCGPMWEIFRCDDLMWHEGNYWVYRPDLRRLKQKVVLPVGTCQLAPPYAESGQEMWKRYTAHYTAREAYVTVLHSSEAYVCGAIALAQSIVQTNSTKDLVLLADDSISASSLKALRAAGWKIKHIRRIRSPHALKDAYNEWNYSKLQVWQLTEYDKVIFIDADLIVLRNIDSFFIYPQLSAVGNDKFLFNSGIMLVEPSRCTFETLMKKRFAVSSYNGGDQGFLNEVFTWWHRWPSRLNHLKIFTGEHGEEREAPEDLYAIHYLGLKPWMCYKDYDCNWDRLDHQGFASDSAHQKWWQVYDAMPNKLRHYCGLTHSMDARLRKWRGRAKKAGLSDGHWKIKVKDPRRRRQVF